MAADLPRSARVVIVGGGVVGCSVAYHLARAGVNDVVLLERRELTCGTTWHAAGLIGQLRPSKRMTELAKYTAELYTGLEAETGQATGFKQNGSISLATHGGRFEELKRSASMAKVFDLRSQRDTDPRKSKSATRWSTRRRCHRVESHIPSDGYDKCRRYYSVRSQKVRGIGRCARFSRGHESH